MEHLMKMDDFPQIRMVYRDNRMKVDDDWGYPHLWKPPIVEHFGAGIAQLTAIGPQDQLQFLPLFLYYLLVSNNVKHITSMR